MESDYGEKGQIAIVIHLVAQFSLDSFAFVLSLYVAFNPAFENFFCFMDSVDYFQVYFSCSGIGFDEYLILILNNSNQIKQEINQQSITHCCGI